MALIKELIISNDAQVRLVKLELPNKHIISRAINHLYLLEIQATSDIGADSYITHNEEKLTMQTFQNCRYKSS